MYCRHIKAHELDALIALYQHLVKHDDPLPAPDILQQVWGALLESSWHDGIVLVDASEQLIGSCMVTYTPNLTRGARPHALIENVVIHQAYQGKGLGKKLMRHAIELAWQRNCYKVALLARESNETACFYESLGFSGTGKLAYVLRSDTIRTD